MAESSRFWTTDGTGDGPTAGYTAAQFYDMLRKLLITDQAASEGVLKGVDNELAVSGTSSPLSTATGAAICYGFFYENTSAKSLTVTTPSVGTTGGRVNLKVDWSAQTVRLTVNRNTDGVADIPALTQSAGVQWDVPLATFTITTGGVITLTDARSWINAATEVTNNMIRNSAGLSVIGRAGSTTGNVADITAGSDKTVLRRNGSSLEWGQAGSDWIADGAITTAKIVNDAVTADKVADGAITMGKLGADAVDDTKLGNRAPQFYRRQGGDASDWSMAGTDTQTPTTVRMQAGAVTANFGSGSNVSVTVTFPTAFSNAPLVFGVVKAGTSSYSFSLICTAVSTTQATFYATCSPAGAGSRAITWLAIGPE